MKETGCEKSQQHKHVIGYGLFVLPESPCPLKFIFSVCWGDIIGQSRVSLMETINHKWPYEADKGKRGTALRDPFKYLGIKINK